MKQNSFPGVFIQLVLCCARLLPGPGSARFESLPIIGCREAAQLLKPAVTQAYLNRDLPLRPNNVLNLITLAAENKRWLRVNTCRGEGRGGRHVVRYTNKSHFTAEGSSTQRADEG